ncbi:TetR/AcrR family transcriptional regulator [Spirilliplanes yamanashiensis]|uniref:TetR family transcriptional regulator n=1 Tax=Spirilliplanes yamanashiensis TaxID=42233 RepID=A0A8J4DKB2_9ACTN|nr:TetR/AcrR family transcriptional regulator [Spirilliplanes yamanashiensis]MDP9815616.1 AcrR family transcriptional regulator [Spirilliplanes yamanashiensis]GIJ03870.1 TetR family transcriptional regulator [Spirilliplanes yamanashiensis]
MDEGPGLRERKKAATRQALHEAALRLAAEHGFERVTVEAIADAADVSRRTFSNYFSSKEEAFFHGDSARLRRMLELLRERPAGEDPWTALGAAAEQLTAEVRGEPDPGWLALRRRVRAHPVLLAHQVAAYTVVERELAAEIARRGPGSTALRARVLAATFLTTLRVATQHWIEHPEGTLLAVLREALTAAAPAPEHGGR